MHMSRRADRVYHLSGIPGLRDGGECYSTPPAPFPNLARVLYLTSTAPFFAQHKRRSECRQSMRNPWKWIGRIRFDMVYHYSSLAFFGEEFTIKSTDKELLSDPLERHLFFGRPMATSSPPAGTPIPSIQIHAAYEAYANSIHLVLVPCLGPKLFTRISGRAPFPEHRAITD